MVRPEAAARDGFGIGICSRRVAWEAGACGDEDVLQIPIVCGELCAGCVIDDVVSLRAGEGASSEGCLRKVERKIGEGGLALRWKREN